MPSARAFRFGPGVLKEQAHSVCRQFLNFFVYGTRRGCETFDPRGVPSFDPNWPRNFFEIVRPDRSLISNPGQRYGALGSARRPVMAEVVAFRSFHVVITAALSLIACITLCVKANRVATALAFSIPLVGKNQKLRFRQIAFTHSATDERSL